MFSSGKGSWAATRRWADQHGTDGLTLLFADTNTEDQDNYRFLEEAAADIGAPLVRLSDGRDVWQVFRDERMIGNTRLSTCSRALKQRPARRWLDEHASPDAVVIVGIDWTEEHRLAAISRNYAPRRVAAPLCEPPYLEPEQIAAALADRGIRPPRLYGLGFAHANCGGFCVRAGQGQFVQLLRTFPERYAHHEAEEEAVRSMLGKDVAILRDRRGGQTRPLTLRALRERAQSTPEQVDMLDVGGCGCFVAD